MVTRQAVEPLLDEGRANPFFRKFVAEIGVAGQKIAAVAGKIVQTAAAFGGGLGADDVEAVGTPPEFVQGAGEMAASRVAHRGIERIPEPILHDLIAPAMIAERRCRAVS